MKRREFIALVSGTAVWPLAAARAQQPSAPPVIGYLFLGSQRSIQPLVEAFRAGLAGLGYTEEKNIRVLYRFAEGETARLSTLTAELVSLGAKVIVTAGAASIEAAHNAAPNVPIVSLIGPDPVMMGWAKTLARPDGMITGLFFNAGSAKRLELLKELRPQATTFGLLMSSTNPATRHIRSVAVAGAHELGVKLEVIELKEAAELAGAFDRLGSLGVGGVVINPDPVFFSSAAAIAALARAHKLPSVGEDRSFVNAGGLLAYSVNYPAMAPRTARFVDQILRGTPPGELAAELSQEFRIIVNLKAAKELDIVIPPAVLARADEVIE